MPPVVARPRLDRAFDGSAAGRLTVVQAPAGYGKTTAVSAWLAASRRPVAWVGLDDHDNDATHLVAHLLASLGQAPAADALEAVGQALARDTDMRSAVIPLLSDAVNVHPRPGLVVVFDDFHVITEEPTLAVMRDLVESVSSGAHVVAISRTRPGLRLARWLASGEASVIGAGELAFTPHEARELLHDVHGLPVGDPDLHAAAQRLHGWPLGLRMLADERGGVGAATGDALARYVLDQALDAAGAHVRRLLLRLAVLPEFNGPLAVALADDPHANDVLEDLRREGQFVVAARRTGWLRIHDPIRVALLAALDRREPGAARCLRLRAAEWLEQHGMVTEAIEQAIMAEHAELLERLVRRHWTDLAPARRVTVLRGAVDVVLATADEPDAVLVALDLLVQLQSGVHPRSLAAAAWELHERHSDRADVQAVTSLIVCSPQLGEVRRSIAAGLQAQARFGASPDFVTRLTPLIAGALLREDRVSEARGLVEPLVSAGDREGAIVAHALLAEMSAHDGDPDAGRRHGRRAVELADAAALGGMPELAWIRLGLAESLRVAGQLDDAREQLTITLERQRRTPGTMTHAAGLLADARLALAERRRARARSTLEAAQTIYAGFPDIGAGTRRQIERLRAELSTPVDGAPRGSIPTAAELRVLAELATTPSRSEIARRLHISEDTVKSHLRRLYRRLGASNRGIALEVARQRGLIR
jgi:LuxR family maltose regulon positive regulatory protein